MSRDMTIPTKWLCAQRRLRSAWASAQSDQSLRCPHEEALGPLLCIERTAQSDLSLRRAHTNFVGFVMSWLICTYLNFFNFSYLATIYPVDALHFT